MHTEAGRVGVGFVAACESEVEHLWLAPVGGGCESWPPAWEDTLFPLPFRSSVLSPQPPVSGSGVEGGGSEEGRGKHLLSMGGLAAGLSQCGWMGSGLGPAGSGRDLLQGWLQMAHSRNH